MKKTNRLLLLHLLVIASALMLIGCTSSNRETNSRGTNTPSSQGLEQDVGLKELIKDKSCPSLCWAGIEPGRTGQSEAAIILQKKYGENNVKIKSDSITWVSDGTDNARGGDLVFVDGVVEWLRVWFDEHRLPTEDLIRVIGQPSSVRIARLRSLELKCTAATLLFHNVGAEAHLYTEGLFVGAKSSQFVESIMFLAPRLLNNWQVTDSITVEWSGYQDYCAVASNQLKK